MHKATLEVNEEGTIAVAATGAEMRSKSIPQPPVPVTVDQPFLFVPWAYVAHHDFPRPPLSKLNSIGVSVPLGLVLRHAR